MTELVTLTFPLSELFKVFLLKLWKLNICDGVLDKFKPAFLNFIPQKEYGDLKAWEVRCICVSKTDGTNKH